MSSKRVTMTPALEAKIRSAIGDPQADTSKLVVFEARALSTEPIQRKGGFYQNAQFSRSTLGQMSDLINTPGKALPLQIMHDNNMLPVGKVFSGTLMDMPNGQTELRVQFYIPSDKTQLLSDIENALIDEVSVGVLTQKALCSECGFDFFGDNAFVNLLTLTCENDHTIGQDGVHINATGLKDWAELSLVGRGAAKDAKILSRAKQAMSEDTQQRLAASGIPMDARLITVNHKLEASATSNQTSKGDLSMDKDTLALFQAKSDEVATLKAQLSTATTEKTGLEAQVATLTATIATKDGEIANLKEANTNAATLAAKVTETETKLTDAAAKLLPHAKAALTASGVADADLPTDLTAMLALIETKGLKLHQVFGAEPKLVEAKAGGQDSEKNAELRNEAFKTKR